MSSMRSNMIPSTASVLSTYTAFAASAMLARTVVNELQSLANSFVPKPLRDTLFAKLGLFFGKSSSSHLTLTIDEYVNGISINEIFQASEAYLATKISPSNLNLKALKTPQDNQVFVTVDKGEKIVDKFNGISLTWEFLTAESTKTRSDNSESCAETSEKRSFRLSFDKKFKENVVREYLTHVIDAAKAIDEEKKMVKLFSTQDPYYFQGVDFRHPSTFETLAMDEKAKREIVEDLDRFVKRKEFYKRIGKAWKRGYLLYGPPGTGKSSLIAAMANHLKFNVYDLELNGIQSNSDLRKLLVSIANRSIIVIEDIDCSVKFENRELGGGSNDQSDSKMSLSGLLNFMDGLWSSCGDERIIVVTTNYKERLDSALLRPGRIDFHIHMSYCSPEAFRTLAFNYHRLKTHLLFVEIEEMLKEVEAVPAEVAEELMRSDNADESLVGLLGMLRRKKDQRKLEEQVSAVEEDGGEEGDDEEVLKAKKSGCVSYNKGVKRNKAVRGGKKKARCY